MTRISQEIIYLLPTSAHNGYGYCPCSANMSKWLFMWKNILTILKDYDHQIIWLDYFNKNLSRKKGRKVGKNISVYDPTMQELISASKTLELDFSEEETNNQARYPRRAFVKSGYIMISKKEKKSAIINQIAKMMIETRQQKHWRFLHFQVCIFNKSSYCNPNHQW